ncbi:hypothetical protein HZH68_007205 [Vespula germanica]|uniref:Uncharacterized protein n=1 Tax=Vespula germanica TaxID=30212 RepID=A0A834N971_VESGE|nr:hypothetical protein HZH68_007205 [Vespula germanica]
MGEMGQRDAKYMGIIGISEIDLVFGTLLKASTVVRYSEYQTHLEGFRSDHWKVSTTDSTFNVGFRGMESIEVNKRRGDVGHRQEEWN